MPKNGPKNISRSSPLRVLSGANKLIHPLILGNLRDDPTKPLRSGLLVAIETGVLLARIGIINSPQEGHARTMIARWLCSLLTLIFSVGVGIAILEKYVDIVERGLEFGLLRILGASRIYLATFVLQEVVVASLPGALLGLVFAYAERFLFRVLSGDVVSMIVQYRWWPAAAIFALVPSLIGALAAMPRAIREGVAEAL